MNFTQSELCRLWGAFFRLGHDAKEEGNEKMQAFYDNERRAVMDRRVQTERENLRRYFHRFKRLP